MSAKAAKAPALLRVKVAGADLAIRETQKARSGAAGFLIGEEHPTS
jgi:hypothetical protein